MAEIASQAGVSFTVKTAMRFHAICAETEFLTLKEVWLLQEE